MSLGGGRNGRVGGRRVTPASRALITGLLWCGLIAGGVVVILGALGEGSGSAPPVATREAGAAPPRPKSWDFSADFARSWAAARDPDADRSVTGRVACRGCMAARSQRWRNHSFFTLLRRYREGLQGLSGFDAWVGADNPSVSVSFQIIGVRGSGADAQGFAHPSVARRAIVAVAQPVPRPGRPARRDLRPRRHGRRRGRRWALRKGYAGPAGARAARQRGAEPSASGCPSAWTPATSARWSSPRARTAPTTRPGSRSASRSDVASPRPTRN